MALFKLRNYYLAGFLFLLVTIFPNISFAGTTVDLVQCVDATQSIGDDFDDEIGGLISGIEPNYPNTSVRLTMIWLRGESEDDDDCGPPGHGERDGLGRNAVG